MRNFIKDKVWIVEPRYQMFYINASKNAMKIDSFPVDIIKLEMYRPEGICLRNGNSILLKDGDIVRITIQICKITSKMSILECSAAINVKYFVYSNQEFEEIPECISNKFIRLY